MKTITKFMDAFTYVARVIAPQTRPPTPIGHRQQEIAEITDKLLSTAGGTYPYKIETTKGEFGHVEEVRIKGWNQKEWQSLANWQIFG